MNFNLKNQSIARKELSEEILEWSRGKKFMFLEMATSTGKSFNSFNIINSDYDGGPILALFPEIPLIESFRLDCIKLGFNHLLENMTLACYASLGKYIDVDWEYVIYDEGHHAISDIRIDHINNIRARRHLGLSATLSEEKQDILFGALPFDKFVLTASEAIERGILPIPDIKIINMELDDKEFKNTFKYGKKGVKCSDRGYYQRLSDSITYWKDMYEDEGKEFQKNKMLSLGAERSRFLAKCKTEKAKNLIKKINTRYIVFCGSLDQAKQLNGKQLVSSEKTKKVNLQMIEDFNEGKTSCLFARNMLREGINLKNCPTAIIIQLNNQEKDFIQACGRTLRHHSPVVYILVIKNTVDERFLKNSLKTMNQEYISYE